MSTINQRINDFRFDELPVETRVALGLNAIADEIKRAQEKFPPFAGAHEGYAVLLEEVDELWHEVKHGTRDRMREEALQVAAMALRFLVDIGPDV